MKLFDSKYDTLIVLEENANEAIQLAARDLQGNLRRLAGRTCGFELTSGRCENGIIIKTLAQGEPEAYHVSVEGERVMIIGSDVLGTVFGIYAFATRCLHISPVYRLVDLFPESTDELLLEAQSFSSQKRPIRFRGWFLNDEDLLSEWRISGGRRNIDYPFYQNVMDAGVLDMVLEAALRLEINLVIPSSFIDIDNPDEEKLVQAVYRRGMFISQHHVEPMGVSWFGADHYLKKHGCEGEAVSFIHNRARMEEIWRYYAEKWAKYKDRVVWQLGLRGKADEAVWKSDPSIPISMEARGGIITDAIKTQYDIIKKATGSEHFYSTATLWNEGSELYGKKYLRLPPATIPIFSDFGIDQMLGADLAEANRGEMPPYGIYYHAGFWTLGPHLSEGCDPQKMAYCYRCAAENNALCYSILNISNVRPLHISAIMNARLLRSPLSFQADNELKRLDRELFGEAGDMVNEIRRGYYEAFADFGEEPLRAAAQAWHFYYREYEELPFIRNAATDGQLAYFGKFVLQGRRYEKLPEPNDKTRAILKASADRFAKLCRQAEAAEPGLPEGSRAYFWQFLKYQIIHMQSLSEWCVACMDLVNKALHADERRRQGKAACASLERILRERKVLEAGQWEHWHRGEKKINIQGLLELTQKACEEINT